VRSGAPAAQVVIVQSGQIVVDQRIGVDELQRTGHFVDAFHVGARHGLRGLQAQNRPDALAPREYRVAHGAVDRLRGLGFRRQQPVQRGVDPLDARSQILGER